MIFTKTKQPHVYRYIHRETYKATVLNTKKDKNTVLRIHRPVSGESGVVSANAFANVTLSTMHSRFQHLRSVKGHKDT